MSQEDVEFVRALVAAGSDVDKQTLLAALPELIRHVCTDDIEWVEDPKRADGHTYHGHDAVLASWRRWLEEWDEYGISPERFIDCGEGEVLAVARERGRGASSGADVEGRIFAAFTLRDGRVSRYREFTDEQDARRAVGLDR